MKKRENHQKFINERSPLIYPNIYKHKKDKRIRDIDVAKGLTEALYNAGFTIESILDTKSSDLATKLGVDDYIGKIIYNETKKLNVDY